MFWCLKTATLPNPKYLRLRLGDSMYTYNPVTMSAAVYHAVDTPWSGRGEHGEEEMVVGELR